MTKESTTRRARRSVARSARAPRLSPRVLAGVASALLIAATAAFALAYALRDPSPQAVAEPARPVIASQPVTLTPEQAGLVEVPDLAGVDLEHATAILQAAGFGIAVIEQDGVSDGARAVLGQEPAAGTVAAVGTTVTVTVPSAHKPSAKAPVDGFVVCIDPGHQAHSDASPEPIGPGAAETKPSVTGGATGRVTGVPEYEVALQIATNLKERLERQGVTVVMTRTTNDVNLSNSVRAAVANKAEADLFIRIHGDGNPDPEVSGISTLYPAKNRWTGRIVGPSKRAAAIVQASVVKSTGAVDRGTVARTDIAGFNYSKVPTVLVECGFLSNAVEDKLLVSPAYQDKLVEGLSSGVMTYLEGSR